MRLSEITTTYGEEFAQRDAQRAVGQDNGELYLIGEEIESLLAEMMGERDC